MAFELPLAKSISDIGPGGGIATASRGLNALTESALKNRRAELENQYYAPNIQSEINQRNTLTKGYDIANQYAPERLRLANQNQQNVNQFYAPNIQSEINQRKAQTNKLNQMTPLEVEQQRIKNQYLPQAEQARINYQNMGGGRGSVAQKDLAAFENQLQADNPMKPNESQQDYNQRISDLSDAYGRGDTSSSNGEQLPPLSWRAQQLQNSIMNRNIPVAARNQLINMDQLVEDMGNFDIDAVADFAGPRGKARLIQAKAQMAANPNDPNIDPMARRYLSAMNQAIINMDQMRKAFGTSVVPDYVYKTIGRLTNPNDSIWNDKTQVKKSYNDVVNTMRKNRDRMQEKYRGGITRSSGGETNKTFKDPKKMSTEEIKQELDKLKGGK